MLITLKPDKRHGTVSGFGVSGAWWAQEVGAFTEEEPGTGLEKREYIAKLLFDKKDGIGINQYRYNLGAGSADSGAGKYSGEDRRAHSFEVSAGVYDWNRDPAAVWMMKAAARYGVDEITLFANSPIERLTKNHKAYLDKPLHTNLPAANVSAFAKYCLDVAQHFVDEGVPVKYISPVNEPVWVWLEKQEGCHYRPLQVYNVMKAFAHELEKRPALSGVKLAGAENGDIRWFNKVYSLVMCADKNIKKHIDSVDIHSYFLGGPLDKFPAFISKPATDRLAFLKRYNAFMKTLFPDIPVKVSEWCHMQGGRDRTIASALEQAKVMAEDIILLDACAWQEWVALSPVDYCDGLIYYNPDRSFEMTKRYYGFGNFSKYIKPGSVRIDAVNLNGLLTPAFDMGDSYALVIINPENEALNVCIDAGDVNTNGEMYVTDSEKNLENVRVENIRAFTVTPQSISTLIIKK